MRRHLWTAALAALVAMFLFSSDASACHKKKHCGSDPCAAPCPPEPCPAPCPEPEPSCVCGKKAHHFGHKLCHKKKACEPVCVAVVVTTMATPQVPAKAAPQAPGKMMPLTPAKSTPQGGGAPPAPPAPPTPPPPPAPPAPK